MERRAGAHHNSTDRATCREKYERRIFEIVAGASHLPHCWVTGLREADRKTMPTVSFTSALRRFLPAPTTEVAGGSVGDALALVFASHPSLRGYLLDDQGALRRHVAVYVNGEPVKDRITLGDAVGPRDEIHVFQALSGG